MREITPPGTALQARRGGGAGHWLLSEVYRKTTRATRSRDGSRPVMPRIARWCTLPHNPCHAGALPRTPSLTVALAFRLVLALALPNDESDDGRLYYLIAHNIVTHAVYSASEDPPYRPTYIRVPGYPLFLAGVYRAFGDGNNTAVRAAQACLDTGTCCLVAL